MSLQAQDTSSLPPTGALGFSTGEPVTPEGTPEPQREQENVVLTLDEERLFTQSLWGRRAQSDFDARAAELTNENRKIEADLTAEEKQLTVQRGTLPPDDFRKAADDFDQKVVGIRSAQDAKARSLTRDRDAERRAFFDAAAPVLSELMRRRGASAILDRRAILMGRSDMDATDEAIRMIDEQLGDGSQYEQNRNVTADTPAGKDAAAGGAAGDAAGADAAKDGAADKTDGPGNQMPEKEGGSAGEPGVSGITVP